jgi:dienelactone hydrolase
LRSGTVAKAVIARGDARRTVEVKIIAEIEKIPGDLPAFRAGLNDTRKESVPKAAADAKPGAEKKPRTGLFHDALPGDLAPAYWAYVPDSYSAEDLWGLVVWIPPARDSMEATILGRWQSLCEERRLILVSPVPAETSGFNPNDLVGARQVIDHFLQSYRVDRNRVVVHGFATGGRFAAALAFDNREQIRGLALVSSLLAAPPPENHPNYPFRFFLSYPDSGAVRDRVEMVAKVLREMKYAVTVQTTNPSGRAATINTPVYPQADAIAELSRWVDSLDRI